MHRGWTLVWHARCIHASIWGIWLSMNEKSKKTKAYIDLLFFWTGLEAINGIPVTSVPVCLYWDIAITGHPYMETTLQCTFICVLHMYASYYNGARLIFCPHSKTDWNFRSRHILYNEGLRHLSCYEWMQQELQNSRGKQLSTTSPG